MRTKTRTEMNEEKNRRLNGRGRMKIEEINKKRCDRSIGTGEEIVKKDKMLIYKNEKKEHSFSIPHEKKSSHFLQTLILNTG